MFIDEARIFVRGGRGGNGCASFRREKYKPLGGPDGGDGGSGGNIILKVNAGLETLMDFRYQRHFSAENGRHGEGNNKHGRRGHDLVLAAPPGTVVKDEKGNILADLVENDQEAVVARGGKGGKGNARFVTSTQRAPDFAEKGEPGEEGWITLELRLLADVAIIGYPNTGKSTLINKISAAKAKVADYPFTTKVPNLGVVSLPSGERFVVADVPGLIENAHKGAGLGLKFLRHIERTNILLHILDLAAEGRDPVRDYDNINSELTFYKSSLKELPQIAVGNKVDLPEAKKKANEVAKIFKKRNIKFFAISALTGDGVNKLVEGIADILAGD